MFLSLFNSFGAILSGSSFRLESKQLFIVMQNTEDVSNVIIIFFIIVWFLFWQLEVHFYTEANISLAGWHEIVKALIVSAGISS